MADQNIVTQQDRMYELIVGDYKSGDGVRITELQMSFDVSLSADNKRDSSTATVEIFNLSRETLRLLETDFLTCSLKAGYRQIGLYEILSGNVTEVVTRKQGADKVTTLTIGEAFSALNHKRVKAVVAPGKQKIEIIEEIRKKMDDVSRGAYEGKRLTETIPYGYPLHGTPKEMLDRFARENRLEWRIVNGVLYVSEENGIIDKSTEDAPLISKLTGLIDIPYYSSGESTKLDSDKTRKQGVVFTALLNPTVQPGRILKLESEVMENLSGFYRVNDIRYSGDYRGNNWYMECFCSKVDGVVLAGISN